MAASPTTMGGAIPHFSAQNYLPSTTLNSSNKAATSCCSFKFTFPAAVGKRSARRGSVISVIRNSSSEVSAETTASESTAESDSDEATVEVRKEAPSLISALNVEKALRGIAITEVDHYGRLGLNRGCSYDEVSTAYKSKVGELNNQGLEEEELTKNLELLKESYSVLSSVEERRLYDWSLTRSEKPDQYMWPFEVDITQIPVDGTPPILQEPEDVGPTRLIGYFILGWLILSFVLSIILNRKGITSLRRKHSFKS